MEAVFPEIQKRFGFGMMRLPMVGDLVDIPQTTQMVDAFLAAGFNYFDTAHGYIGGQSEQAVRTCLTSRYPRDRYILTNKLSNNFFEKQEDIRPLFETQLEVCGVDYFDFYLMHAQSAERFEKYRRCRAYETALELKAEGKIRHLGISFHDSPEVLETILTAYPQIETGVGAAAQTVKNPLGLLRQLHQRTALHRLHDEHRLSVLSADLIAAEGLHSGIIVV